MMYIAIGSRDKPSRFAYHELATKDAAVNLAERMYECASFDIVQVFERPNPKYWPSTPPIWTRGVRSQQLRLEDAP